MHIYSVLAHMDAKMVRPELQRPFEGLITVYCELSPMASTEYEPVHKAGGSPLHPECSGLWVLCKLLPDARGSSRLG